MLFYVAELMDDVKINVLFASSAQVTFVYHQVPITIADSHITEPNEIHFQVLENCLCLLPEYSVDSTVSLETLEVLHKWLCLGNQMNNSPQRQLGK